MSKKLWTIFSLLLIGAMLLVACGGGATTEAPEAPAATEEKMEATEAPVVEEPAPGLAGTITLWHSLKEGEIEGMTGASQLFSAANPDVTFDTLFVPFDDLRAKYETAVASGEGPCLLIGAADWGPALYNAELVTDVSGFAELSFLQGINQAALASVRYKDAIVGLPLGLKGVVLYRNSSIVADAPAAFADLLAKAQAATSGDVVGANLEHGFFFSAAHLDGVGGQLMDASGNPTFNDDKGVAWLNMLNQFTDAGPAEYYTDNDVNLFKAGKAGMIIDGTWNLNDLAAAIGEDNLSIDVWPSGMSGYVQNDNVYMGANADRRRPGGMLGLHGIPALPRGAGSDRREQHRLPPGCAGCGCTRPAAPGSCGSFRGRHGFPGNPRDGRILGSDGHRSEIGLRRGRRSLPLPWLRLRTRSARLSQRSAARKLPSLRCWAR